MSFWRTVRAMVAIAILALPTMGVAQDEGPLRIEITEGIIEPIPYAIPDFVAENAGARALADQVIQIIRSDLASTGLFREIPPTSHIARVTNFSSPVQYSDWKAINAQVLVTGSVRAREDGGIEAMIRVFDVFLESMYAGGGVKLTGSRGNLRRVAHKLADLIYSRILGESSYFDTQILFVSESGEKNQRVKRLAIMDFDGANLRYLTDGGSLVLAPRFSPDGSSAIFTSFERGEPGVYLMNLQTGANGILMDAPGMTFAPRFSPDGERVIFSRTTGANTDIYEVDLATRELNRRTVNSAIDTAPSYAPDGTTIVFESDRSGRQQLYVQPKGGEARRISFGPGRYGTPVWSPRGDYIAFTKFYENRFHIGVVRTDGSEERLLSASFLDEGPSWSPNGRVLLFFRESRGVEGGPRLRTVDITGRNPRVLMTPEFASDPAWSPLRR